MGLHCSIMLFTPFIVGFLLVGTGQAKSLTQKEGERLEFVINGENLELRKVADGAEERMGGLVGSIALTLLTNMIKDIVTETVLGMLGITTTPAPRPIIDAIGDLLGITEGPTTTAAPSQTRHHLAANPQTHHTHNGNTHTIHTHTHPHTSHT